MKFRKGVGDVEERSEIPELLIKALSSLDSESLLVLPGEIIVHQSEGLTNLGILREERIVSEDLIALIRVVRRTSEIHRGSIEVARGPVGGGKRELRVSAAPLTADGLILVLISY